MIPSDHFDAFMQYIMSIDLSESSKREVERFIFEAIDLPASSADRVREAFASLRAIFSQETLGVARDLPARIDALEVVSVEASRVAAIAHDQIAHEAPQAKPAENIEPPIHPPAPAPQAEAEHESSDSENDMPRRVAKRKAEGPAEEVEKKRARAADVHPEGDQPAHAEAEHEPLHSSLARARSFLSRAHSGAQNHLPFLAGNELYAIWTSHQPGVGLITNIQKSGDFSSGVSQANKLSFTLDRFGRFLSVWENGHDTHSVVLPEKWGPLVQAAVRALDELYRGDQ